MTKSVNPSDTLEIATPTDREVVLTRVFDAPRHLVFDAYTKPEHITRWMFGPDDWTMPICEVDLRVGGAYRYVWSRPGRKAMEVRGVFQAVAPPDRLVFTEGWGGNWPETVNTLALSEKNGKTTVTTTILYPSRAARDAALDTGMNDGASRSYARLDGVLRAMA
jgi:uncharacterized protein YndB with AHSA1/START domain